LFGTWTYLVWLALFVGLPLLGLTVCCRKVLWRQRRAIAWVLAGSLVGGWAWDALAVRFGLWTYDPDAIVGWWFLGLPLEEWLWIVGVTLLFAWLTLILAARAGLEERA
jgi:lycopene cyclase domain-containing protein